MRVMLNVPYKENHLAKKLGCRFDRSTKRWFVEDRENLEPFMQWVPDYLKKPCNTGSKNKQLRPTKKIDGNT